MVNLTGKSGRCRNKGEIRKRWQFAEFGAGLRERERECVCIEFCLCCFWFVWSADKTLDMSRSGL